MKNKNSLALAFTSVILTCLMTGCGGGTLCSELKHLPDEKWSMYDPASFSCKVNDTINAYDISFILRSSTQYPYRNIYLFVVTSLPSGVAKTDTLQYSVADEKGKWLGRGVGDIRELTMHYKTNILFPEKGEYHFRIVQGMRDTELKGVYDFGMKIKRRKN